MDLTDREYVEQCLDSHPEAYRHLVGRYEGVLQSFLTGRLGDRDRAQEAAQETFVRAYVGLGKLKKRGSFLSWLLGIGTRVAKEQSRDAVRQRELSRGRPEPMGSEPDPAGGYDLERCVGDLPDPYRQVILLRYYKGLSCIQVAERMGMPVGTVTKYLSRAYEMLREMLQGRKDAEVRS
jgi:RNA polymerase sigma-70 factor, ECF subfamily